MQPIHRRGRLLKQSPAIAGAEVAGDALADGDLLMYDAATGEWLTTKALVGDYSVSGELTVGSGISTIGGVSDIGQVGPFAFMDWNSTHARFGGYDWDTAAWKDAYFTGYNVYLKPQGGWVLVPSGGSFRLYDSTNTDYMSTYHDGTNVLTTFGGTDAWIVSGVNFTISSAVPAFTLYETDAAVDEKYYQFRASGGDLFLYLLNDASAATTTVMSVARSTSTVTQTTFNATELEFNGTLLDINAAADISGDATIGGNIYSPDATSGLTIAGGSSSGNGANIELYGGSHATLANQAFVDADTLTLRSQAGTNRFILDSTAAQVRGGLPLRVYDSGNTDYGAQSHDGTDYNWAFTNTTDLNITGITYIDLSGRVKSRSTGSHLSLYDTDDADTADYTLIERNGGNLNLYHYDAGTTTFTLVLRGAREGATTLYYNGASRIIAGTAGLELPNATTSTTVGAAGAASALPANPTGYLSVVISGTTRKIPYYAT